MILLLYLPGSGSLEQGGSMPAWIASPHIKTCARRLTLAVIHRTMMRELTLGDYSPILRLLDRAFAPSVYESSLVRNLRENLKISFDFCIEEQGRQLAYFCYTAAYSAGRIKIGYHLAPVAVLPEKQGQGLGHRIISESLKIIGDSLPVYVLGASNYYSRFGFKIDRTPKCSFDPSGFYGNQPLVVRHQHAMWDMKRNLWDNNAMHRIADKAGPGVSEW